MCISKRITLAGVGLLSVLLMGCAGGVTYTESGYYTRDHVYVDRYHRHYHPPHVYPAHRYPPPRHVVPFTPRHDGGFIGGGGHPDAPRDGGFVGGSAPAISASQPAPARVEPRGLPPATRSDAGAAAGADGGFSGGPAGSSAAGS